MNKKLFLNITCGVLTAAVLVIVIWGAVTAKKGTDGGYSDGMEQVDLNTIHLNGSKVEVSFSEVLLSNKKETRKLIVSEQTGTVSTELTERLIQKLDFDILKKTQQVTYTGKGYFVVDLDDLTRENIIEDKEKKTVSIFIDHAYLQAIEIDPDDIMIDEVKEGLLARGDIELTVADYKLIEKELRTQLEKKFNTSSNGQEADQIALKMVKEIYEPIVKAIDSRYSVIVNFK